MAKYPSISRGGISSSLTKEYDILVLRYKKIFHAKIFKVDDYLNDILVTSYEGELKFY